MMAADRIVDMGPGAGSLGGRVMFAGTRDDVQLTFDVGLMGLANYNQSSNVAGHTQFDLLNFELFGWQRPLIEDPGIGAYGNSRERAHQTSPSPSAARWAADSAVRLVVVGSTGAQPPVGSSHRLAKSAASSSVGQSSGMVDSPDSSPRPLLRSVSTVKSTAPTLSGVFAPTYRFNHNHGRLRLFGRVGGTKTRRSNRRSSS